MSVMKMSLVFCSQHRRVTFVCEFKIKLSRLLTFNLKVPFLRSVCQERSPVAAVAADGLTSAETLLHY